MFPLKNNSEFTSATQEEELEEMDEKPDVVQNEISNNPIETSGMKYEAAQPESSGQHKQENPPLSSNRCRNVFKESVKLAAQKARAGRTSKSIPQSSDSFLKSYHRPCINEPDTNRAVSSDPTDEHFSSENVSRVSSGKRKRSVSMKSLDASEDLNVRAGPSGIRPRSLKQDGKKEYVCPICNEEFEKSHDFDVHFDINHREKLFPCNTGKKASAPKKNLQNNKRDTKQKVFVCDICGKKLATKSALNSHRKIHSDERPFVCDVCTKGFTRKSDFNKHCRTHSGEKPFGCDICNKGFARRDSLLRHHRTHTGEKLYICEVCQKQFSTLEGRKGHSRTHTGEKPFACSVCNNSFSTSSKRNRHEKSHSGKKPYECSVCGKTFTRKDNCDNHYKSKHK